MIFDTHAHYNSERFQGDLDALIAQFAGTGIGKVVNVSSDPESLEEVLALLDAWDGFLGAAGIHPSDSAGCTTEVLERIEEMLVMKRIVALGEIGLDYYWKEPARDVQRKWFLAQLELAKRLDVPVIIHSRDAAQETFDILESFRTGEIPGVIHCYSYSPEMAAEYVRRGFMIGVGGVVTFKNARKLTETVRRIPIESIVVETDCPYLAPSPHRGERNSSLYLPLVIEKIAELKGMEPEEVEEITWKNAERLYRING